MGIRVPVQGELGLRLSSFLGALLSGRFLTFLAFLLLLLVVSIELIAILEYPLALAVGLVVGEAALIENTIRVNPLAVNDL